MKTVVIETNEWAVHKDEDNKVIIVSYFENGHFVNDISISYHTLGVLEESMTMAFESMLKVKQQEQIETSTKEKDFYQGKLQL